MVLATLALLLPTLTAPPAPAEVDFQALAHDFLERHGLGNAAPGSVKLATVLDGLHYARVRLGAFDLRYPAEALREKAPAVEFEEVCLGLLDLQREWVRWSLRDEERFVPLAADIATLSGWVKSWSPKSLAMLAATEERDLLVHLGAAEDVRQASERAAVALGSGEFMGLARKPTGAAQMVLAPTRRSFIEWTAFAGLLEEGLRTRYWHAASPQWTKIWSGSTQIFALEYPDDPYDARYPERGVTMNDTEKTGVVQHAVDAGAASLFWHWFGPTDAFFFESALATDLTIAVCGESNVRIGGITTKSSGASTQPYERFVPGGNPNGGTLPARDARSEQVVYVPIWRQKVGKDYFVDALTQSQKEGGKKASKDDTKSKDERVHFTVFELDKGSKTVVSAPFFGPHAGKTLPPNPYLDDYEDFFRSYKACFSHWLRNVAGGKKKGESETKFAELLVKLAGRNAKETSFEQAVEQVYGIPLSGADGSVDSLEWRFLDWLSKQ